MKKLTLVLLFSLSSLFAQNVPETGPTDGPPPRAYTKLNFYDAGTGLLYYQCFALSQQIRPTTLPAPSAATNGNPVSLTVTGHGFDLNATPKVTISGATSTWAGINGSWTATVVDANTLTVAFNSTSAGSFSGQTLTVTTLAPRMTLGQWSVRKFFYDTSSRVTESFWAAGSTANNQICSNHTTLAYQ